MWGSAAGFLYPICIQVANLSKEELPSEDFVVVAIPGLAVNGHIDPRCDAVGYLCLMGQNVPQKRFFDWFYETVTIPTCRNIRKKYNYEPASATLSEEVPIDSRFVMWGDSDIPYLQQMTSPERIAQASKLGIYFAKIGAKITETAQPLDLGPFFKILKISGKHMTSVGLEKPLTNTVIGLFQKLRNERKVILSTVKENALKDLLITAPDMVSNAFTKKSLVASFQKCGMLDEHCARCPDLFKIMKSFKVKWELIPGGKNWFLSILPHVIAEMYSKGEVNEKFYQDHDFPLDADQDGNVWTLNSDADHLTRSKVMYHPSVIEKKANDIKLAMQSKIAKAEKRFQDATNLIELNKDCEKVMLRYLTTYIGREARMEDLSMLTLEITEKINATLLGAFYRCRIQKDLTDKVVLPIKGTAKRVRNNELTKKQMVLFSSVVYQYEVFASYCKES